MSNNALEQVRGLLNIGKAEQPKVMSVAEVTDTVTVVIDQDGARINVATPANAKTGDKVIVSGGKVVGFSESPSITVWIT